MHEEIEALRAQHDELAALLAGRPEAALDAPSRCPGWTVADVLLHLAQTDEMALASLRGELEAFGAARADRLPSVGSIDELAGALVDLERTTPAAALERWRAASSALVEAFPTIDPHVRVQWVAGTLAARTLATTRLAEAWIHTVDVAVAWGPAPPPTDRLHLIARLAWRTLPHAFTRADRTLHGPVAFVLEGPHGTTWRFDPDAPPATTVTGDALDLCTVAGQRGSAGGTTLRAVGPDADEVLALVRTFA